MVGRPIVVRFDVLRRLIRFRQAVPCIFVVRFDVLGRRIRFR
jgi:hypothetical protein